MLRFILHLSMALKIRQQIVEFIKLHEPIYSSVKFDRYTLSELIKIKIQIEIKLSHPGKK
jgi:hypothetical protein